MRFAESQPQVAVALVVQPVARARATVPDAPRLSQSAGVMLRRIEITDERGERRTVHGPVERPLQVLIDGRNVATLWTLGASSEWLVLGYLRNQQIISKVSAIESINVEWSAGVATVTSRPGAADGGIDPAAALRPGAALDVRRPAQCRVSGSTLLRVLDCVARDDTVYRVAGSAHGCALFCASELWLSIEDVSRRNAVDTISGWMALHGVTGDNLILYSTGRLTVEIVMKAAFNGISTVVSGKGMTASCCELADRLGMTLFGHAAKGHFSCYAGAERFDPAV
ncbi:MAG TPA: formate dehydrogenase accessory sulfurtransferase FdhD [Steroidobacteraceae bacterium]|jgi:FdhD protein|nr:formate dehydrogenase accessory sulfurtransferase FdhD [Steroidobacteraceae bacterium]